MKQFSEIFRGLNGLMSSKRVGGTICIIYSMLMATTSMFISPTNDIPENVKTVILEFLLVGAGLLSAGLFETKKLQ